MTILYELNRPTIFAHRGASAHAPENTLASFNLAVEHGADAIELDAKLSADGQIVVHHDQTVNRTTDGKGRVNELPLAILRELDAGSFFAPEFQGEKIPLLEEVLDGVGRKLFVNIELTNYASPNDGLPEKVAELVKRMKLQERVLFSSFYPGNLQTTARLLPNVPVGLLAEPLIKGWLARSPITLNVSPRIIHPYLADATAGLIRREHARGRRVHVWTVNAPADMRRLFAADVDGIFTDDPRLARQVLQEK